MPTFFSTATDAFNRLSERGVQLRLDDRPEAITSVLRRATNTVKMFLIPNYAESDLLADATNGGVVNDLATSLSVCYLCERRANTPPAAVQKMCAETMQMLDDLRAKTLQLPNVDTRSPFPVFSNIRVMPGYIYKKVRVEVPISDDTPASLYNRVVDWSSVSWFEY